MNEMHSQLGHTENVLRQLQVRGAVAMPSHSGGALGERAEAAAGVGGGRHRPGDRQDVMN